MLVVHVMLALNSCTMNFHVAVLFVIECGNMVFAQVDVSDMLDQTFTDVTPLISHELNGYNPTLPPDQVLIFICAKPSDKLFIDVYFKDPDIDTKLDFTKPVAFIVHGWQDNASATYVIEVSKTWVENHDMNVCRVDWSIYAMLKSAYAVQKNFNLTAHHLATFIRSLHDVYGLAYGDVILMGHSVGAQICGITGYILEGQIGRIIGLDPSALWFTVPFRVPLERQLDKSDAQFVIVIHSNSWMTGVGFSIGHADFYVNGGISIQPGCTYPFLYSAYDYDPNPIHCSHFRSVEAFHLALLNNPDCIALKCDTLVDYTFRTCTNITDSWGLNSNKIEGDFYFWIGSKPKCRKQFWPF